MVIVRPRHMSVSEMERIVEKGEAKFVKFLMGFGDVEKCKSACECIPCAEAAWERLLAWAREN